MAKRVQISPSYVRVSRPGYDADTGQEQLLLLSLGARNMQIIQRGYKTPDSITVPSGQGYAVGEADFTFNIGIPAQSSTPDFRGSVILKSGQDRGYVTESGKPAYNITYASNQITVVVIRGSTNQFTGIDGLSYSVFRKRVSG